MRDERLEAFAPSVDGKILVAALGTTILVLRASYFEERWRARPRPAATETAIIAEVSNLASNVKTLAVSATGGTIAAAGSDERWIAIVKLNVGSDGGQSMFTSRPGPVNGIALSPDGQLLAVTGRDRMVAIYDVSTSEDAAIVAEYDLSKFLFAYGTCVQFSPAADMMVVGGDMRKCTIWGARKGTASPADSTSSAWRGPGNLLRVIGRGGYINAVCFDEEGAILALTGGDWKVAIYDVHSDFTLIAEVPMAVQHQHCLSISCREPSPPAERAGLGDVCAHPLLRGLLLAVQSGRDAGVLTLVDLTTLCSVCEMEGVHGPSFTRGGALVCCVGGAAHVYDVHGSQDTLIPETLLPGGRVRTVALNHDGSIAAVAQASSVRLLRTFGSGAARGFRPGDRMDELDAGADVAALAFSPFDTASLRLTQRVLDRNLVPRELHARIIDGAQLRGKLALLTASHRAGAEVQVFCDVEGALTRISQVDLYRPLPAHEEEARAGLCWSEDGQFLAVASEQEALLVDVHKGTVVAVRQRISRTAWFSVLPLRDAFAYPHVSFGTRAFYAERDHKNRDLKPLMRAQGLIRPQAYAVSHSGALVAVGGNGKLHIFDTEYRESVLEVVSHGWIMGIAWAANDKTLAIGGHNKSVRILDVASGSIVATCGRQRSYWPLVLAFSGDGRAVIDANVSFSVTSCDGSRLPLSQPSDPAPLLRCGAGSLVGEGSPAMCEQLLTDLIMRHPQVRRTPACVSAVGWCAPLSASPSHPARRTCRWRSACCPSARALGRRIVAARAAQPAACSRCSSHAIPARSSAACSSDYPPWGCCPLATWSSPPLRSP